MTQGLEDSKTVVLIGFLNKFSLTLDWGLKLISYASEKNSLRNLWAYGSYAGQNNLQEEV